MRASSVLAFGSPTRKAHKVAMLLRIAQAKDKYLEGMPKKPKGAIQLFLQEKLKDLKKVHPSETDILLQVFDFWLCSFAGQA